MFIFSYFIRLSTGVLGPDLMRDLRIDARQLGMLGGAFFYAFAIAQVPVGLALDAFRPKRVIVSTIVLAAFGCIFISLAENFKIALYGRILLGFGMSAVLMGGFKILTYWFRPDEFGFLSGVMLSLGNFGALIAATPLVSMSSKIGWRNCFLIFAIFVALGTLSICFAVKDTTATRCSEMAVVSSWRKKISKAILSPLALVFSNRHFWCIAISALIRYGSLISIQGFLGTLYLIDVLGYSVREAGNILSMISIGYLLGSPLAGWFSDAIFRSRKKVMLVGLALFTVTMVSFLSVKEKSDLFWYFVFFGVGFFSSVGAVAFAHVKELFPDEVTGLALTAMNFFNIGGVGIGQQVLGVVVGRFPKKPSGYPPEAYHEAFAIIFAASIVAFIVYLAVRDTHPSCVSE
jgi:sugar phosphate permease